MSSFRPMVKMETTEPSVVLKLKKGGHVNKKDTAKAEHGHKPMHKFDGGAMPAPDMGAMNSPAMIRPPVVGAPAMIRPPVAGGPSIGSPRRPSMADRQKAMAMAKSMRRPPVAVPAGGLPTMKKGGKLFAGKETYKEELAEGKAIKSGKITPEQYAKGEGKEKKMATGGVALGQGGYKKGGIINTKKASTLLPKDKPNKSSAPTGEVKLGKPAGFATGGITKSDKPGEFKKGGAAKKFADGGRVDSGRAVSMPQGHKKPTPPVATNLRAGTFKKGGKVAHKEEGGYMDENKAYERWKANEKAENLADRNAMSNLPSKAWDLGSRVVNKIGEKLRGLGGVTDTVREVSKTVVPAKKSGGKC